MKFSQLKAVLSGFICIVIFYSCRTEEFKNGKLFYSNGFRDELVFAKIKVEEFDGETPLDYKILEKVVLRTNTEVQIENLQFVHYLKNGKKFIPEKEINLFKLNGKYFFETIEKKHLSDLPFSLDKDDWLVIKDYNNSCNLFLFFESKNNVKVIKIKTNISPI